MRKNKTMTAAVLLVAPLLAYAQQAQQATYRCTGNDDARARALKDNQETVRDVENKIEALKKRRAGYDKELEFYQDKKGGAQLPAKLAEDIKNTEIDLRAQEELLAVKRKEVDVINARYDDDRKRYGELTGRAVR